MAHITEVALEVFGQLNPPQVRVSYRIEATGPDAVNEQRYRELVELIGVDEGPHEDGQNEVVATLSDGIVKFDTSHVAFVRSPQVEVTQEALNEDPGIFFRRHELRARVSLTPLPPEPVIRDSNLVVRGELVLEG